MTFAFPDIEMPGARWCLPAPPAPALPSPRSGPSLEALRARVRRYNSDVDPASDRFRAAVLLMAGLEWGQNVDRLARRTGYDRAFVARCVRRLIDNGVWVEGRTVAAWSAEDEASGAFWNDVAVAEGLLCRRASPDGTIEWAPPGFWNKSYQFVEPAGEAGLSVRYHDATRSEESGSTAEEAVPEEPSAPEPARNGNGGPARHDERPPLSLDEVFTGAVWLG